MDETTSKETAAAATTSNILQTHILFNKKKLIPSNPNGFDQPHLSEIVLKTSQLIKKQQQQQIPHSCKF